MTQELKHQSYHGDCHRECMQWFRTLFRLAGVENPYWLSYSPRANEIALDLYEKRLKSTTQVGKEFPLKDMGLSDEEVTKCQSILDICNGFENQVLDNETHKRLSQERCNGFLQEIKTKEEELRMLRIQLATTWEINNKEVDIEMLKRYMANMQYLDSLIQNNS